VKEVCDVFRKYVLMLFMFAFILTGCGKEKVPTFSDQVNFEELHETIIDEIVLEDDSFHFMTEFYISKGNDLYDYANIELDFNYNNQTIHIPLFRDDSYIERSDGSVISYYEQQDRKSKDAWYNETSLPSKDQWITVHLFKNGHLLEGFAEADKGEFWNFYYYIDEENIDHVSVKITGKDIAVSDIDYRINNLSFFMAQSGNLWFALGMVGISILLIVVSLNMSDILLPIIADIWLPRTFITCALLIYGVLGVMSHFVPDLYLTIMDIINAICVPFDFNLSFTTGVLGYVNGFLPYVSLILGVLVYIMSWPDLDELKDHFVFFLSGIICVPAVYVLCLFVKEISIALFHSLMEVVAVVVFLGFIAIMGMSGGDDSGTSSSYVTEEKKEEPEKKEVRVWRENEWGHVVENYKVSSDGERYYDPKDGEWHRIK